MMIKKGPEIKLYLNYGRGYNPSHPTLTLYPHTFENMVVN